MRIAYEASRVSAIAKSIFRVALKPFSVVTTVFVQIVPEYPPKIGGVGSYAAQLAQAFQDYGESLHTIVTHNHHSLKSTDTVSRLISPTKEELQNKLEELGASSVLLHFSGYGYARWGLCHWLVESLSTWKQKRNDSKLITLFHEVYAVGPIWRASFWTSHPQQEIARKLASLSDAAFVTSQGGYERLKPLHPELSLEVLPVFSTVGEPEEVAPLQSREGIAVVFGGAGQRDRTYRALEHQTDNLVAGFKILAIKEVIDIGPGDCAPKHVAGFPIRTLGTLANETISDWLKRTRVGLSTYPLHMITKSTIWAAYFAHGLLTVNVSSVGYLPHDLAEKREFVDIQRFGNGNFDAQTVAFSGFVWYQSHSLLITTRRLLYKLYEHS